jgi:hypothetical protein
MKGRNLPRIGTAVNWWLVVINMVLNICVQQNMQIDLLTLNLLTTTIVAPPSNASKWQMGFNSAFKVLSTILFVENNTQLFRRRGTRSRYPSPSPSVRYER